MAAQVAIALTIAAAGHGPLPLAGAIVASVALLGAAWVRVRRRWLFEWVVLGARYRARPHTLPTGASAADLVRLLTPDSSIDESGVIADNHGLTAVLVLGDHSVLAGGRLTFPAPASLLPPAPSDEPPTWVQLLLTSSPAPVARIGGGPAAASYRQLSDGHHPAYERAVLALRMQRAEGWSEADLRRSLTRLVRQTVRRLEPFPARHLDGENALRLIAELAHHDGSPIHETWDCSVVGRLRQASFHLRHRSAPRADTVPRILALPTAATTVSVSAGPGSGADLTVRLASDTSAHLAAAAQALRRLAATADATTHRLDGEHLPALAATLPLSYVPPHDIKRRTAPSNQAQVSHHPGGLVVGRTRDGEPTVLRLFRPVPTLAMAVGGSTAARLVVFRAIAIGARIVVQTARPRHWEPLAAASGMVAIQPPDRPRPEPPARARPEPPARPRPETSTHPRPEPAGRLRPEPPGAERPTPLNPVLVVLDTAGPPDPAPGPAWSATLVVRDLATPADVEALTRADVVLLEPMRPDQAALVGAALGLGDGAEWLTRIGDDMVGLANGGRLRWLRTAPTAVEHELVRNLNS